MKERPILFSGAMVRAILEGRKTQTRRILPPNWGNDHCAKLCRYGVPGDRLWVREAWQQVHPCQIAPGRFSLPGQAGIPGPPAVDYRVIYRADGEYPRVHFGTLEHPYRIVCSGDDCQKCQEGHLHPEERWCGWTVSIHMPRWASRLTLEIVSVRVERIQDISEEDAFAEGIGRHTLSASYAGTAHKAHGRGKLEYRSLWNSINEKRGFGWEVNPWVWAIEFRRSAQ